MWLLLRSPCVWFLLPPHPHRAPGRSSQVSPARSGLGLGGQGSAGQCLPWSCPASLPSSGAPAVLHRLQCPRLLSVLCALLFPCLGGPWSGHLCVLRPQMGARLGPRQVSVPVEHGHGRTEPPSGLWPQCCRLLQGRGHEAALQGAVGVRSAVQMFVGHGWGLRLYPDILQECALPCISSTLRGDDTAVVPAQGERCSQVSLRGSLLQPVPSGSDSYRKSRTPGGDLRWVAGLESLLPPGPGPPGAREGR